jgi:hypothetical protein
MRPRIHILLYCGNAELECRLRLVLQTRLKVVVHSPIENPDLLRADGYLGGAVIWQNGFGQDISETLRSLRIPVLEVVTTSDPLELGQVRHNDIAELLGGIKRLTQKKRGPRSAYMRAQELVEVGRRAA